MGRYSWGWTMQPIADGAQEQLVVDYDDGSGWTPIFAEVSGDRWEGGVEALHRDPAGFRDHERALRRAQKQDRQDRIPRAVAGHHLHREPTAQEVAAVARLTWGRPGALLITADAVAAALATVRCGLCGNTAKGFAEINDTRFCHGDFDFSPTCYEKAQGDALRTVHP